jgi:hypothetical protein
MKKTILLAYLVLLMLTSGTALAQTQYNETIPAGSGTLSYTVTVYPKECTLPPPVSRNPISSSAGVHADTTQTYYLSDYSAFSYTVSGTKTPLSGSEETITNNDPLPEGCGVKSSYPVLTLYAPPVFPFTSQPAITFTPSGETGGAAALSSLIPGIIYPKYQIQSIIYDPPGNLSSNGFTNSTTDGTTTTVGSSFAAGDTVTFTVSDGFLGLGSSLSWSYGLTQTTGNSTAATATITDASGVAIAGPGSSGSNTINHEQDWFVIWINPAVVVYQTGADSVGYAQGTQLQTTGDPNPGEPEAYLDQVEVEAQAMMANADGVTTVPLDALLPVTMPDGEKLPGLAAICANPTYYPNSCTAANQCGCVPSDFAPILAQDLLLNYSSTESPLNADTSGAAGCGLPTPAKASCRYVPVPTAPGSDVQEVELLSGPDEVGGTRPINSFTQTDSNTTTQTYSESLANTVGFSWQQNWMFLGSGISLKNAEQFTWTSSESTGEINGYANSMAVSLSSSTVDCYQEVPVFEDTVYHTFVFSQPAGNTSCP